MNDEYTPGKWKEYALHTEIQIAGFFGPYRFLSNFEPCKVYFEGDCYPSSENAYQAAKTLNIAKRMYFVTCTPREAKERGKKMELRKDWDSIKQTIMRDIVTNKFDVNASLFICLKATGERVLIEKNHWNDLYWGVDLDGIGENNLGKILMNYRKRCR